MATVATFTGAMLVSVIDLTGALAYLRFSPDSEVVLLKLGEARIGKENLEELPDILRRLLRRPDSGRTVREADPNRLVDEEPTIVPVSAHHLCTTAISHMLDTSFHEFGLRATPLLSFLMRHGPSSWKSPIMLELPGCDMVCHYTVMSLCG